VVKLSAQEEYGLRCLLQIARRSAGPAGPAADPGGPLVCIRDVAEAEGLSVDYAAKLLRVLRQGGLLEAERGATGGYRLARPPEQMTLSEILRALDTPIYAPGFCEGHAGQRDTCVHLGGCSMRPLWMAVEAAVHQVLAGMTLADLLTPEARRTDLVEHH
jgi:Rrf2 family protein